MLHQSRDKPATRWETVLVEDWMNEWMNEWMMYLNEWCIYTRRVFKWLSDFERGMVVGARRAGLSISKTVDLLGFSRTTISRVYREWSEKEKKRKKERFIVYCCKPKALYNHVVVGSLLNHHQCVVSTWMMRRLPQYNGASALTTHQLQVERRESHRANRADGDYLTSHPKDGRCNSVRLLHLIHQWENSTKHNILQ